MKHHFTLLLILVVGFNLQAQIGIGTTSPDASALLELHSTSKGFLLPRLTKAQMESIGSPAEGLMLYCSDCDPDGIYFFNSYNWVNLNTGLVSGSADLEDGDVVSLTGKIWQDRNLGAVSVASSATDADAYGNLYQWGRSEEGHESRTASLYSLGYAGTSAPSQGNGWDGTFILSDSQNSYDWLANRDNTLWNGVSGTNNPCPSGYRIPSLTEWQEEINTWSSQNAQGAFNSVLKLSLTGSRTAAAGSVQSEGLTGEYWTSSTDFLSGSGSLTEDGSYRINVSSSGINIQSDYRANAFAVRCIKDY